MLTEIRDMVRALQEEIITLRERVQVLEALVGLDEDTPETVVATPKVLTAPVPAPPPPPSYFCTARIFEVKVGKYHGDRGCMGGVVAMRMVPVTAVQLATSHRTLRPCLNCLGGQGVATA